MIFKMTQGLEATCEVEVAKIGKEAAEVLVAYLKKITGVDIGINEEKGLQNLIIFKVSQEYGKNGFAYKTQQIDQKQVLVFYAENEIAFTYAVYDFLERIIGCRYFTASVESIPHIEDLIVQEVDYHFVPVIEYREIYYKDFEDQVFARKHKCAQSEVHEGWGFWCHSFQDLLPSDKYFEEHPEYFAWIDGERNPKGEPCLSNPKVRQVMIDNLRMYINEKPECLYWSVSQNDDNAYCQCEACQKIDEYDESPMGSVLNFVNQVAEEFPEKMISTLSYWYTRKPPKHTRPAKNVHIMTCNIEANRGLPIENDPMSKESKEEMEFWASLSSNVSLWDYNIQFRSLVSPFPNLHTLQPNMQFFVKNNMKLLFSQCNREIGGEWSELRGYLLAKLAWDPECDIKKHAQEFCEGYYQEAAPFIEEYLEIIHAAQLKCGKRLDILEGPEEARETYLTEELFNRYVRLFEQARISVAEKEEVKLRVEIASLPVDYTGIVLKYGTVEERMQRIKHFAKIARKSGLKMVEEWKITVDQFVTDALAEL